MMSNSQAMSAPATEDFLPVWSCATVLPPNSDAAPVVTRLIVICAPTWMPDAPLSFTSIVMALSEPVTFAPQTALTASADGLPACAPVYVELRCTVRTGPETLSVVPVACQPKPHLLFTNHGRVSPIYVPHMPPVLVPCVVTPLITIGPTIV